MMRLMIIASIFFFSYTSVYSLEKMTEPEMKNAIGQAKLRPVLNDLAIAPAAAEEFGPFISPVPPIIDTYSLVSPHVDPVIHLDQTNSAAEPVVRIMRTPGDISGLGMGGFF